MKLEEPENVEYALGEYLSELCGLLEMDGYHVSIEKLHWEPVQIQICTDFAGRIIDNLVSNIKKYAHPDLPVFLDFLNTLRHLPVLPSKIRSLFLINLYTGQALVSKIYMR